MIPMLSDHFSLAEGTVSDTAARLGIVNTPNTHVLEVMYKSALGMERVRALLKNKNIHINSWYRSPELNIQIGSKSTSQHCRGEAIDFICPLYGNPAEICKQLVANSELIRFDQLILEHTWVHISFAISSGKPRGEVLTLLENKSYATGLTTPKGIPL